MTETQKRITEICDAMKELLLYKNEKYGDSALRPSHTFYKGNASDSIRIRLDDKLSRVRNSKESRVNDVADVIGYCTLLLVSLGAGKDDMEKLRD